MRGQDFHPLHIEDQSGAVEPKPRALAVVERQVFHGIFADISELFHLRHLTVSGQFLSRTKRDNFTFLYRREARLLEKAYDFDVVVAYQEDTATAFVSYFVDTKRIAWIHCDYGAWSGGSRRRQDEYYSLFDGVVCVSEGARRSFVGLFPELEDRTHAIYNLLNINDIVSKAEMPIMEDWTKDKSAFRMVSVGRLSAVKQFGLVPAMARELKDTVKRPFQWYIIGSGDCETAIREEIMKYHMEDAVILLGAKDNPYPYMKEADLVACTSNSESFSYVIAEAKVLHTPVLSNDFPVAYEVIDESCGWIANVKDMPSVLSRIIDNVDGEYDRKKAAAVAFEYTNTEILKKIDELLQN